MLWNILFHHGQRSWQFINKTQEDNHASIEFCFLDGKSEAQGVFDFCTKEQSSNWAHFYSKTVNGAFDIYKSFVIPGELGWNEERRHGALNAGHWLLRGLCFSSVINGVLCSSTAGETVPVHRRLKMPLTISMSTYKIKTFPSTSMCSMMTHWPMQVATWLTIHFTQGWPVTGRNSLLYTTTAFFQPTSLSPPQLLKLLACARAKPLQHFTPGGRRAWERKEQWQPPPNILMQWSITLGAALLWRGKGLAVPCKCSVHMPPW